MTADDADVDERITKKGRNKIIRTILTSKPRFELLAVLYHQKYGEHSYHDKTTPKKRAESLSLAELSDLLEKTKPAVHYLLKDLKKYGFVKEFRLSKSEKRVSGSIRTKYYSLTEEIAQRLKQDKYKPKLQQIAKSKELTALTKEEDTMDLEARVQEVESLTELSGEEKQFLMLYIFGNETRARILMILLMYDTLSLTDLSKLVDSSKATVSRNINEMATYKTVKIIKEGREHHYTLSDDIMAIFTPARPKVLEKVSDDKKLETYNQIMRSITSLFNFMKYLINLIQQYNEKIYKKMNAEKNPQIFVNEQLQDKSIRFQYHFLTTEEYEIYQAVYAQINQEINKLRSNKDYSKEKRPYLAFKTAIRLPNILGIDKKELND